VNWLGISAIACYTVGNALAYHKRVGTLKGQNGTVFYNNGIEHASQCANTTATEFTA